MTQVTITKTNGFIHEIELVGHANYASYGKDIVCAAISMASQMTLIGLEEVANASIDVDESPSSGYLKIRLYDFTNPEAITLVNTLELTLERLASQYPENIQVCSR